MRPLATRRCPSAEPTQPTTEFLQWAPCRSRKPVPFTDTYRQIGPMSDAPSHMYTPRRAGRLGSGSNRICSVHLPWVRARRDTEQDLDVGLWTIVKSPIASLWDRILLDHTRSLLDLDSTTTPHYTTSPPAPGRPLPSLRHLVGHPCYSSTRLHHVHPLPIRPRL